MKPDQILPRVVNLLTKPQDEWKKIAAEQNTIQSLFIPLVLFMSAVPAVFLFLGSALAARFHYLGYLFGMTIYHLIILPVFVLVFGLIINEVIPLMGGKKQSLRSMYLSVYTFLPFCLLSVLFIFPSMGMWWLVLILSLYGVYLLYLGLKSMFEIPQQQLVPLTAIAGVIFILFLNLWWYSSGWFFRPY